MQAPGIQPSSVARPSGMIPLLAAVGAFALGWLGPLAFPFRLLTTIIHELGHGLAALLTGGAFVRFVVFPDGSGLAYTAGGMQWLIIPAGYLGTAFVGAGLIMVGRSPRASRIALGIIGAVLVLLTLRYALPSVFSAHILSGLLTLGAGLALGAGLLWVAWKATLPWALGLLNLLAFWIGLSALSDLRVLFQLSTSAGMGSMTDAHAMAQITFLPAAFWAILWVIIALGVLGSAFWYTWIRPRDLLGLR
ncbi:MAG: M50 family peptidase [Chloroflexia bacterium]|nr:M50 family peptidase [Chloroflexia bacterium]